MNLIISFADKRISQLVAEGEFELAQELVEKSIAESDKWWESEVD